jgi:L-ascorbate metabolism protein UlaG (beta-lactamase superfamily)
VNHDLEAIRQFEHSGIDLPAGLELQWLGVSGYRMTYQGVSIFIDPYVSRAPLKSLLLRRTAIHDEKMIERFIDAPGEVAGVLVGHTHFDHAIDAPQIARRFGTKAYGSASLGKLMALHGLNESVVVVEPKQTYELGPFQVRFIPSAHSKLILGKKVPFDGELTCDHLHGLTPGAYKCGQVWGIRIEVAGVSFYHQGSADLLDDELPSEPVDFFLAGVAGRSFTKNYWRRTLPKLDPAVIVPTHYDDFFKPLGSTLKPVAKAKLDELPDEIARVSGAAQIAALTRIDDQTDSAAR